MIDDANIKEILGTKYNASSEYVLVRQFGIANKAKEGFKPVGKIPDATGRDDGFMTIMERKYEGGSSGGISGGRK